MKKITAIVRSGALEQVEKQLQQLGVPGITVTAVKGYGEYANFFSRDWMVPHAKIEIFAANADADRIVAALVTAGRTGIAGDGIVVVQPVDTAVHIRSGNRIEDPP